MDRAINKTAAVLSDSHRCTDGLEANLINVHQREFSDWIDRELNILVGRWLSFTTKNSVEKPRRF